MLSIQFVNDGTGDEIVGNYRWGVFINKRLIAKGALKNFNRLTGWEGLAKLFGERLEDVKDKVVKTVRNNDGDTVFEVDK